MDNQRFLLALVLSGGVLFLWQYLFPPAKPDQANKNGQAVEKTADAGSEGTDSADDGPPEKANGDSDSGDSTASADAGTSGSEGNAPTEGGSLGEEVLADAKPSEDVEISTQTMKSEQLELKVTNARSGRITSATILSPEQYSKRGDLLEAIPDDSEHFPFGVRIMDRERSITGGAAYTFQKDASETDSEGNYTSLVYRYDDPKGRYTIEKVFDFTGETPFMVKMDVTVTNHMEDRTLGDTAVVDMYGYKDPNEETSFLNFRPNDVSGACKMADSTERSSISGIESPLRYDKSMVRWGAIDTRYFMWATIPAEGATACDIEKVDKNYLRTRLTFGEFEVGPGATRTLEQELFLGPKDVDMLKEAGHELTSSVDFGFLSFLAWPLHWSLSKIHNYVGNWGVAIILLTILIKLLTWPINMSAYRNMNDMKEIQPKLEELRDKYEDDRQKMTEETMKLFQENDVSPMGGCLPMLLQMPILYALYIMIYNSVELYEASFFLWYTNLAAPDPFYVLPILMGVVMYGQQGMMGSPGNSTQAQIMTKVMPVMFTAFMLFLPSGLVLYYSMNLAIGLGQQLYIRGWGDDDDEEPEVATA